PPAGAVILDLSGKTVLPGLIDCHVHLTGELKKGWEWEPVTRTPIDAGIACTVYALRTLRAGCMTVRKLRDRVGSSVPVVPAIQHRRGARPGPQGRGASPWDRGDQGRRPSRDRLDRARLDPRRRGGPVDEGARHLSRADPDGGRGGGEPGQKRRDARIRRREG